MKKNIVLRLLSILLLLSGCNKISDFGDTNVNPGKTNTPVASALLTNVLSGCFTTNDVFLPGYYCQYFSETQYTDQSCYGQYVVTPMGFYSGRLYDLQNIIITNTNEKTKLEAAAYGENDNQIAIARILKAYLFWKITDRWGDIPYSESLKGDPNVKYDTQESIYKDLIKELAESVAQFKSGVPVKGDIVYKGDISKWKKFANSLRMLMALNLSKHYPGINDYAAVQFKEALNDQAGSIESNSDNFQLNYPGGAAFRNIFFDTYNGSKYQGESETFTSLLVDTLGGDARQAVFGADINGNPSNLGVPYGRTRGYIDDWCKQHPTWCLILAPAYRTETSPFYLIKAASVLLARAEAADRGWTSENTSDLYQAGINASFAMWGLQPPGAGYFAKPKVALGTPGTNLKQIATQQYIAYYPFGLHGWNTWRRTGWPVLLPAPDGTNFPKVIPRRHIYAQEDYALNSSGVAEAVARLGTNGDKMDSRVWWDKE